MTENTPYDLNHVRQCHVTPEELENSQTKIILYTKHFQKELNATKCRTQHQREKWHCIHNDHSSIDHTIAGITSELAISPEQCRYLAKGEMIFLADQFVVVEYDTKNPIAKTKVLLAIIIETIATQVVGLLVKPASLICNERHLKSGCQLGKFCHVHWKS